MFLLIFEGLLSKALAILVEVQRCRVSRGECDVEVEDVIFPARLSHAETSFGRMKRAGVRRLKNRLLRNIQRLTVLIVAKDGLAIPYPLRKIFMTGESDEL
ncbi:hypothetical protein QO002_002563 [Pararhizobium capsulatum DSM 1112]|uniref:Transposase DDE domain-containing protein n=1 Tax=Pararhizobium capsulatum DSM 1112 TaxID=1121113 RepID=A0ABU0BQB2_9HYPH|nr:hypothetical protein [Pararhizobium capsulatum]MDQ0320425.1 hypothetical protein [Pararhizobium capsulatum DSM 1112]